jgi:hypothetical protein
MRFTPSIFGKLLEPIQRRQFDTLVKRHAGDAYVKSFASWNHLLALVYAQFAAAVSLRGLEAGWTPARQPTPPTMQKLQKSAQFQLCLTFPDSPALAGEG